MDGYFLDSGISGKGPSYLGAARTPPEQGQEKRRRRPKSDREAWRRIRMWFWTKCFVPLTVTLLVGVTFLLSSLSFYENYKDISMEYDAHERFLRKSGTCPGHVIAMFAGSSSGHEEARETWARATIKEVEIDGVLTNCPKAAVFCSKSVAVSAFMRTVEESYWYTLITLGNTTLQISVGIGVLLLACFTVWAALSHHYSHKVDARIVDGLNRAGALKAQM